MRHWPAVSRNERRRQAQYHEFKSFRRISLIAKRGMIGERTRPRVRWLTPPSTAWARLRARINARWPTRVPTARRGRNAREGACAPRASRLSSVPQLGHALGRAAAGSKLGFGFRVIPDRLRISGLSGWLASLAVTMQLKMGSATVPVAAVGVTPTASGAPGSHRAVFNSGDELFSARGRKLRARRPRSLKHPHRHGLARAWLVLCVSGLHVAAADTAATPRKRQSDFLIQT